MGSVFKPPAPHAIDALSQLASLAQRFEDDEHMQATLAQLEETLRPKEQQPQAGEAQPQPEEVQPQAGEAQPQAEQLQAQLKAEQAQQQAEEQQPQAGEQQPRAEAAHLQVGEAQPHAQEAQPQAQEKPPQADEQQPSAEAAQLQAEPAHPQQQESEQQESARVTAESEAEQASAGDEDEQEVEAADEEPHSHRGSGSEDEDSGDKGRHGRQQGSHHAGQLGEGTEHPNGGDAQADERHISQQQPAPHQLSSQQHLSCSLATDGDAAPADGAAEADSAVSDTESVDSSCGESGAADEFSPGPALASSGSAPRGVTVPRLNLGALTQLVARRDEEDAEAAAAAVAARAGLDAGGPTSPGRVHLLAPVVASGGPSCSPASCGDATLTVVQRTASVGEPFQLPGLVVSDGEEGDDAPEGPAAPLGSPTGAWLQPVAEERDGGVAHASEEQQTAVAGEGHGTLVQGSEAEQGGDECFFTAPRGRTQGGDLAPDQGADEFHTCQPATTDAAKSARVGPAAAAAAAADAVDAPEMGPFAAAPEASGSAEDSPAQLRALCRVLDYDA